jgi:hypothetical protein
MKIESSLPYSQEPRPDTRCCPLIYLQFLRKSTKNHRTVCHVVEIRTGYIPNARQMSYMNELLRWLGLLQVIWRWRSLVTKAVVFRLSRRYSGLRLCDLLRCVGWLGWAANLRCASTRKNEDVKMKVYGAPTVFTCTSITDASDLGDSFCCRSHWEACRRIRNAFSHFVVRQS